MSHLEVLLNDIAKFMTPTIKNSSNPLNSILRVNESKIFLFLYVKKFKHFLLSDMFEFFVILK